MDDFEIFFRLCQLAGTLILGGLLWRYGRKSIALGVTLMLALVYLWLPNI